MRSEDTSSEQLTGLLIASHLPAAYSPYKQLLRSLANSFTVCLSIPSPSTSILNHLHHKGGAPHSLGDRM